MFEIGQQVVCIFDKWENVHPQIPVKGRIYTVRGACAVARQFHGETYLLFEEVRNPIDPYWRVEPSFRWDCFRPLRKTDISVFTEMLAPVQPADAGQAPKKLEPA